MTTDSSSRRLRRALAWLRGALATWALSLLYFAIVFAVCFPVIVGSVTGAFMLWDLLSLDGPAGTLYFVTMGAMVMVEYTVLRRLMDGVGTLVLRPER